jgi:hypothetical protein
VADLGFGGAGAEEEERGGDAEWDGRGKKECDVGCGQRGEGDLKSFEISMRLDAPPVRLYALDLVLLSRYPFGKHFSFSARLTSPTSFHLQMGPRCTFIGQHLLGKFNPKMIENCQSPLSPPHHLEKAIIIIHIIYYLLMLFLAIIGIN